MYLRARWASDQTLKVIYGIIPPIASNENQKPPVNKITSALCCHLSVCPRGHGHDRPPIRPSCAASYARSESSPSTRISDALLSNFWDGQLQGCHVASGRTHKISRDLYSQKRETFSHRFISRLVWAGRPLAGHFLSTKSLPAYRL